MILPALFFYLFAGVCVASAVMVIVSRNPVHSVLFLILAFVNASGLFILMGAEFLGMMLIVVYVGAVAVLFLFVIMMLDVDFVELREGFLEYLPIGLVIGAIFLVELLLVAMIGAIVLTLRHKAKVKRQDINVQNARTPELAMALRKVTSGQGLQDADAAEWVK